MAGDLPEAIQAEIQSALNDAIATSTRVSGGCISPAACVQTRARQTYFVKWAERRGGVFAAEAYSLERIAETQTVRVPGVVAYGRQWLLLEWIEPGDPGRRAWSDFGTALARLHRARGESFGWPQPNYIGALPQQNLPGTEWAEFWRNQRLEPQLSHAVDGGLLGRSDVQRFEQLFARLEDLLATGNQEGASLLHGDLWSGNAHPAREGIVAIDPSAYYGHREVDLAMADLFGGFPSAFREAYEKEWPLRPVGREQRRAAYQIYYLLVHVNLFGGGYVARVRDALRSALA
ncbi:MAG: fructosamine kinase family protein [Longimicrobiales bacterium]